MLLLWFHSIPFLLRTLPRADMESAPTVCQSRNILPAANFGGVGGTPPYILPEKGNVGRPALWPPCPLPATANLPCNPPTLTPQTKASLVKGRCRACEAEGFLPVCGCDSVQGIARRNPSGRLRRPPPFDKGGWTVEKLHPCLIACVGATMGRPLAYRRNAISGTVFIQGKRARAGNARPYKRVSTRSSHLKLHFKFHSCKIRQSVLQSHSIPF